MLRNHILILMLLVLPGYASLENGALASQPDPKMAQQDPDQDFFIHPNDLTDEHVQWAIRALTDSIYARQNSKGTWERQYAGISLEHLNSHASGQTSLALFALLSAGESYQQKRLQPAFDFLLGHKSDYTYVRSLRAQIFAMLPQRFDVALKRECEWLLGSYGYNSGSWGYNFAHMASGYDNSLTQYGVLGLWEGAKREVNIPDKLWSRVESHFLRTQLINGGWNYRPNSVRARGSMTAAGLTCLFITQDFLHSEDYLGVSRQPRPEEEAIQNGLHWLDEHFTTTLHPGGPGSNNEYYFFYYLYGIERVGLASGYRRFAGQDWYRTGAASIVQRMCEPIWNNDQQLVGFKIKPKIKATGNTEVPIVQLSFALMFLSHGRVPIVISKLQDERLAWNNRPRDAANLSRWISDEVEEHRNWQILDKNRPIAEWFDGPLVYLATHERLEYAKHHRAALQARQSDSADDTVWQPTQLERLKRYLELGGTLITTADARKTAMTQSVKELSLEMFPHYTWRRLPDDHWAFHLGAPVLKKPELYSLTNGVRDLIFHFDHSDAGAILQANRRKKDESIFTVLSNLYFYASERGQTLPRLAPKIHPGVREAGPRPSIHGVLRKLPSDAPVLTVWRGQYQGSWNPEPGVDELVALRIARSRGVRVQFQTIPLASIAEQVRTPKGQMLWLRGVEDAKLNTTELNAISQFAKSGGVVFIETVGGIGGFARTLEEAIEPLFPKARFRRPTRHPVVQGNDLPLGEDCTRVTYRLYSLDRFGARENRVRLRALNSRNQAGQPHIFVSREDVSFALLDQPCWGVSGYVPRDAERLIGNLIEFALLQSSAE